MQSGLPGAYWAYAHAIDNTADGGKYIKLETPREANTDWGRYAGVNTRLRFRYFITGGTTDLTVKFDGKIFGIADESWTVDLSNLETDAWTWVTADFTHDCVAAGSATRTLMTGDEIINISFLMPDASGSDEFYVDEVTLYEPR